MGVMTFQRLHESRDSSPAALPAPPKVVAKPAAPRPAAKTSAKPRPATPSRPRADAAAPVGFADKLPARDPARARRQPGRRRRALRPEREDRRHRARRGAGRARSSPAARSCTVDVRTHDVDSLNAKYGAVQDPAVLVLRPPGRARRPDRRLRRPRHGRPGRPERRLVMRFGRHTAPAEEPAWNDPRQLAAEAVARRAQRPRRTASCSSGTRARTAARRDAPGGRPRLVVRRRGGGLPAGHDPAPRPGPYTFADAHQASAFVTEAVAALMYLGCDIQAS